MVEISLGAVVVSVFFMVFIPSSVICFLAIALRNTAKDSNESLLKLAMTAMRYNKAKVVYKETPAIVSRMIEDKSKLITKLTAKNDGYEVIIRQLKEQIKNLTPKKKTSVDVIG